MRIQPWATACLLFGLSLGGAAAEAPVYLFGSIGTAKVSAIVTREADGVLSGWYLYLSRGKQIRLSGKLEAQGAFHLDEFADDIKSGAFDGRLDGATWTGTWRKPDGQGTPLAVSLHEALDIAAGTDLKVDCTTRNKIGEYTYDHALKLTIRKGRVTRFKTERAAKGDGDEQSCSAELSSFDQVDGASGLTLQSQAGPAAGKSESCRIRIVGDSAQLYVRMGGEDAEAGDCRSADGEMFCAPRAAWTDMIVDRATGRCRSVQ